MPNRNGQGPRNAGSKTGKGLGLCSKNGVVGRSDDKAQDEQLASREARGSGNCGIGMKSGNGRQSGVCAKQGSQSS